MYKSIFITLLFLTTINIAIQDLKCPPQKGFYISYYAMGKRDTLANLFSQINQQIGKYNSTYTNQRQNTYMLTNLYPQMYYNQHHQLQSYIDEQHVNVTLGDIELAFISMNYQIHKGSQVMKGTAHARVLVDQYHFFTKRLLVTDGVLQWDPVTITNLSVNNLIAFDNTEPKLQHEDLAIFQNMMNDHIGQLNIKDKIVNDFNVQYQQLLKKHLNAQHIIPTVNFQYKYKNITINYTNAVYTYALENKAQKGLRVQMFLQIQNFTTNCTNNTMAFDQKQYGGLQGVLSLSTLSQSFRYAIQNGLYSAQIDKNWQVPTFQFYMGDLGMFVPQANNYPADDQFAVSCQWAGNHDSDKFTVYSQYQLYTQTGMKCSIKYKITFQLNIVAKVIAQENEIIFLVDSATVYGAKFQQVDAKFKVFDTDLGKFMIGEVVSGLKGVRGFGSGFKTAYRYFPAAIIVPNYLLIFDAALQ